MKQTETGSQAFNAPVTYFLSFFSLSEEKKMGWKVFLSKKESKGENIFFNLMKYVKITYMDGGLRSMVNADLAIGKRLEI